MQSPSIGALVDQLFRDVQHPSGREYSYSEVGEACGMDPSYVRKLRLGQVPNPGIQSIEALCRFFGVDADYFMPGLARERGRTDTAHVGPSSFRFALRSTGLTPEAQQYIEGLVSILQRNPQASGTPPPNDVNPDTSASNDDTSG